MEMLTSNYEVMFVISKKKDSTQAKAIVEKLLDAIKPEDLTIKTLAIENFAYPIKHEKSGYFFVANFRSTTKSVGELNRLLKISSDVLRYLVINTNKNYGAKALANQKKVKLAETRAKKYEEVRRQAEINEAKGIFTPPAADHAQQNPKRPKIQKSQKRYLRNSYRKVGIYFKNEAGEMVYEPIVHAPKNNLKTKVSQTNGEANKAGVSEVQVNQLTPKVVEEISVSKPKIAQQPVAETSVDASKIVSPVVEVRPDKTERVESVTRVAKVKPVTEIAKRSKSPVAPTPVGEPTTLVKSIKETGSETTQATPVAPVTHVPAKPTEKPVNEVIQTVPTKVTEKISDETTQTTPVAPVTHVPAKPTEKPVNEVIQTVPTKVTEKIGSETTQATPVAPVTHVPAKPTEKPVNEVIQTAPAKPTAHVPVKSAKKVVESVVKEKVANPLEAQVSVKAPLKAESKSTVVNHEKAIVKKETPVSSKTGELGEKSEIFEEKGDIDFVSPKKVAKGSSTGQSSVSGKVAEKPAIVHVRKATAGATKQKSTSTSGARVKHLRSASTTAPKKALKKQITTVTTGETVKEKPASVTKAKRTTVTKKATMVSANEKVRARKSLYPLKDFVISTATTTSKRSAVHSSSTAKSKTTATAKRTRVASATTSVSKRTTTKHSTKTTK